MRIAIIGAGAMGCRFGASLLQAGANVTLCDIWQEHINAINQNGLITVCGGVETCVKINAVTDIAQAGEFDVLIIFTKSQHTESAINSACEVMPPHVPVVTFQNGLGNIDTLKRTVGTERIIAGITNYPSDLLGPGRVCVDGTGYTKLMALGTHGETASTEICKLLRNDGMNCELSYNIMREIWEKLAFNNAMNSITAITRLRVGDMGGSPYGFELCSSIAREVCNVAKAEGADADLDTVIATFKKVIDPNESGNHLTSMLQDVLRKKQTEIDSICLAVIKRAESHGINTPYLRAMYNLIKLTEENYENRVSV